MLLKSLCIWLVSFAGADQASRRRRKNPPAPPPALPAFDGVLKTCISDVERQDVYMIPPPCPKGIKECVNSTNHCASLTALPDGGLGLGWFSGYREGWDMTQVVMARLRPNGTQWSSPISISQEKGFSLQNVVLHVDAAEKSLYAFHVRQPKGQAEPGEPPVPSQERYGKMWLSKSEDWGTTWGAAEVFEPENGTWTRHDLVKGLDGSWLLPLYNESQKPLGHYAETPVLLRRPPGTPLQPYTGWEKIEMAVNGSYLVQPSIVRLVPGKPKLKAFFRDRRAEWIYSTTSEDDGRSWSEARATPLPNNNVGISATRLLSGSIGIAFSNMQGQTKHNLRNILAVAVSDDEGETFPHIRTLEHHPATGAELNREDGLGGVGPTSCDCYSYPSMMQSADGTIHIAYTYERRTIKVTSVSEAWIRDAKGALCQFGPEESDTTFV